MTYVDVFTAEEIAAVFTAHVDRRLVALACETTDYLAGLAAQAVEVESKVAAALLAARTATAGKSDEELSALLATAVSENSLSGRATVETIGARAYGSTPSVCSVCSRLTGFGDEERFEPPVNLARCPAPGGMECRAVAQAVAPLRRENEALRSNSDHLSSENASLARQVESMAMRIDSLAEELAKPEDVRLREVLDALEGRAVIFDGLGARVGHVLDEMDEWIGRAGEAERTVDAARRRLACVADDMTEHAYQELASALESPPRIAGKTAGFDQPGREYTAGDALGLKRDR